MNKFKLFLEEQEEKPSGSNKEKPTEQSSEPKQTEKSSSTSSASGKKEIDKSIPVRDLKAIFAKIAPFIKLYAPNSYRTARQITPNLLQLVFGGARCKVESDVLYDVLSTKFSDEFDISKSRLDRTSQTVTLSIY